MRLVRITAAVAMLLLGSAASAAADETPAVTSSLSWVRLPGAESCISTTELAARVEERLGRRAFVSPSVAALSIEGRAERSGPGGRFRLVVSGARRDGTRIGHRELTGTVCRDLDEGLVLVLALMIDPNASLTEAPPLPTKEPEPVPPPPSRSEVPAVHEAAKPIPPPPAQPTTTTNGALLVKGGVTAGRAESVVGIGAIGLRLELTPNLPLEGAVQAVFPSRLETEAASHFALFASLALCPQWMVHSNVALGGCLGVAAGVLRASGADAARDYSGTRGLFDVLAEVRTVFGPWGPVRPFLGVGPVLPIIRQRLVALDAQGQTQVLYARPAVGVDGQLGVIVNFSP